MREVSRFWLIGLCVALLPLCMGSSCTTTDLRDAVFAGVLDYVRGTTTDSLSAVAPVSEAVSERFSD